MTTSLAGAVEDWLQPFPATRTIPMNNMISDQNAVRLDLISYPSKFSLQYTKRHTF
jgi:hypothetical protein